MQTGLLTGSVRSAQFFVVSVHCDNIVKVHTFLFVKSRENVEKYQKEKVSKKYIMQYDIY